MEDGQIFSVGSSTYRNIPVYRMQWHGIDLSNHLVAVAPCGGPVGGFFTSGLAGDMLTKADFICIAAIVRERQKLARHANGTGTLPSHLADVSIYSLSGTLLRVIRVHGVQQMTTSMCL